MGSGAGFVAVLWRTVERRRGGVDMTTDDLDALVSTREAASYCGYKSPAGLLSAYRRGKVFRTSAGRCGGWLTWRRRDFDAFF
jgi:hypothetical protein